MEIRRQIKIKLIQFKLWRRLSVWICIFYYIVAQIVSCLLFSTINQQLQEFKDSSWHRWEQMNDNNFQVKSIAIFRFFTATFLHGPLAAVAPPHLLNVPHTPQMLLGTDSSSRRSSHGQASRDPYLPQSLWPSLGGPLSPSLTRLSCVGRTGVTGLVVEYWDSNSAVKV